MERSLKDLVENRSIYYDDVAAALAIVREFIIRKKRVLYGGMAIDLALKEAGKKGIYGPTTLPDYDFWSPDFLADSIELADLLYAKSVELGVNWNVSSINAMHVTTRRVRINFIPVADITYIPTDIYNMAPTLYVKLPGTNDKVIIVHPDFQRMDIHRAFSTPYEKPPLEVFMHRSKKDQKRYWMLAEAYPIIPEYRAMKLTERIIKMRTDEVYGGLVAFAMLFKQANIQLTSYMPNVKISGGELIVSLPEFAHINIITDNWQHYLDEAAEFGALAPAFTVKPVYYNKYLDDYCPRSIRLGHLEIFDNSGRLIPFQNVGPIKVTSAHSVLLYLLQKSFLPDTDAIYWRTLYRDLEESILCENPPECMRLSAEVYGAYNASPDFINSMVSRLEEIEQVTSQSSDVLPEEDEILDLKIELRPKSSYYPDRKKTPPTFDPSQSPLFAINARQCQPFQPLPVEHPFIKRIDTSHTSIIHL